VSKTLASSLLALSFSLASVTHAGNLEAELHGSTLKVTGDDDGASASFTTTIAGPNSIAIQPTADGTTVNGNGPATVNSFFNDDFEINALTVGDVFKFTAFDVTVKLGKGNNDLELGTTNIGDDLTVTAGSGDDTVNTSAETSVSGTTKFSLGGGVNTQP